MQTLARQFTQWWIETWRGDPFASDLAMQGEHRVARSRFLVVSALAVVNASVVMADRHNRDFVIALLINLAALLGAFLVLVATRRGSRPAPLQVVTMIGDVTAVTLLHAVDLLQGTPSVVLNGRVTFTLYFLAMVGTVLRFNPWIATLSGVIAGVQYGLVALWAVRIWPGTVTPDIVHYGHYDWGVQVERIVTLMIFGGICGSNAAWAMELRSTATHDMLTGLLNRRTFHRPFTKRIVNTVLYLRQQRLGSGIGTRCSLRRRRCKIFEHMKCFRPITERMMPGILTQ